MEQRRPGDGGAVDRPLLKRAGVIGADEIGPDDAGNVFIPVEDRARPTEAMPASGDGGDDEGWSKMEARPETIEALTRLGATPEGVAAAPVSPDELVGWLWHGFTIDEIRPWLRHGSVRAAVRRRDAGLPP
jgi:hypothetical protein